MSLISRLVIHLRRLRGACRFDVPYRRAAALRIPRQIRLNGEMIPVHLPDELGVKSDILGCLFEDVYGLAKIRSAPNTILDIGANVGLFSLAARSYFPNASIHAYEPNPRSIPFLEHQAKAARFSMFPEAVGAHSGAVTIAELGDSNLAQTRSIPANDHGIAQVSLEDAVRRFGRSVELAKVDCEGAEWDLFEATEAWKEIKRVRMEYHLWGRRSFDDVVDKLRRLGFTITKHVSSGEFGLVWCERNSDPATRGL